MSYPVGQVASFAGVTVRTLHHYDEIGLLSPSARSHAGHRRYDDADLDRLQRILFYRELGFPLEEVAHAMEARKMGINLTPEERFEVFGDHDPDRYEEESRRRWGDTEPYRQSQRKVSAYTKEDWLRIKAEGAANTDAFAALMDAGTAPSAPAAMDLAEEHRQQICRNFYDCGYEIHSGLARMYSDDERFRSTFEQIKPGLAAYLTEAILANAARHA
ncbi:MerR family transcriptional regulator [Streptomyces lydicus]|uniref:MerR family transcriptional regulator n=1 Tax=Streptomyces lydicus TaxID=47763 RepID=UPI0009810117|nr:MerR family transcriptional regulator [Streptomyces lydicus]